MLLEAALNQKRIGSGEYMPQLSYPSEDITLSPLLRYSFISLVVLHPNACSIMQTSLASFPSPFHVPMPFCCVWVSITKQTVLKSVLSSNSVS